MIDYVALKQDILFEILGTYDIAATNKNKYETV